MPTLTSLRKKSPSAGAATQTARSSRLTVAKKERSPSDDYVPLNRSNPIVAHGLEYRMNRLASDDMLTSEQAAKAAGTSRVTINHWVNSGRCIGLTQLKRGYRLPKWQFDPAIWDALPEVVARLGSSDGWTVLTFLESPHRALDGISPRAALERGAKDQVLRLATAEAH